MKLLFALLIGLCTLAAASKALPVLHNYDVQVWDKGSFTKPDPNIPFALRVYTPANTSESFGVMVFVPGFSGICPASFYDTALKRIASRGVVVVGVDRLQKINFTEEAAMLNQTIDWLQQNLKQEFLDNNATANPNTDLLVLGGHSAGCHTVVQFLSASCRANAAVLIDPVDGNDPLGIIKDFIIDPPNRVNFTTPCFHIETGYDEVPKASFLPACAPLNLSNDRFFNAWNGPIWQLNGTEFAHDDVMDKDAQGLAGIICGNNNALTEDDRFLWRNTVGDYSAAFIRGVIYQEPDNFELLEDSTLIPVKNVLKHDYHGYDAKNLGSGFCKFVN